MRTLQLAHIGELASSVAHELNNPLSVVSGRAALLRDQAAAGTHSIESVVRHSEIILATVRRISAIIRSMTALGRDVSNDPYQDTRVDDIVDAALLYCRERMENFQINFEQNLLPAKLFCRSSQIAQVLHFLISDACDACHNIENRSIRITGGFDADHYFIEIWDSASTELHGLSTSHAIRSASESSFGLGLQIAEQIMKSHSGGLGVVTGETCHAVQLRFRRTTSMLDRTQSV